MSYTSSIINKYGDNENVKKDAKALKDILNRQGYSLIIDCMSEFAGDAAFRLKLDDKSRDIFIRKLLDEIKESLEERL